MSLENAILCNFGMISQTLGAAFPVLAAFVVYQFQTDLVWATAVAQMLEMLNRDRVRLRTILADQGRLKHVLEEMETLFGTEGRPVALAAGSEQHEVAHVAEAARGVYGVCGYCTGSMGAGLPWCLWLY